MWRASIVFVPAPVGRGEQVAVAVAPQGKGSLSTRSSGASQGRRIAALQRGRIIAAIVDVVEREGYADATLTKIISRARMSRTTFYQTFESREDCFLAAFEHAAARARQPTIAAYRAQPDWLAGTRAALDVLLALMEKDRALARLVVVDALAAGPAVLRARSEILRELAAAIDRGRHAPGAVCDPVPLTGQALVAGIVGVLHARLLDGGPLRELLGQFMSMTVQPYLGPDAARRELGGSPAPAGPVFPLRYGEGDPLADVKLRLTYRTVLVLAVVGEHPGASNREVAQRAGVSDAGQISKLLGRLAALALIENRGAGQARGAANAWHLTDRGSQLERATRPR